ncbi:MAG: DUF1161 domain-containing protein [Nevskia sp.]|jgi:hypothetical protein|nr:DUF1161 domain-containing protein [Nevskia sp.]MCK9385560.1 DUF1161 domain-containing protein [Nevskia sp.]
MKKSFLFLTLLAAAAASAAKPCTELQTEIMAKLEAKGVKSYHLDVVPNNDVGAATVVGSCDGGTKKITYKKG